jgi:rhodanese-related sulfurtransferase
MKRLLFVLVLSTLFIAACAGSNAPAASSQSATVLVPGGSYTNVSATQLKTMLDRKDFTFVNVHIPYEGEIANTDAFVPYNEIEKNLDKLPADKNAKIILYCRSGRMSTLAAEALVRLGYSNVWNIEGGMIAWEALGLPLKTK